MAEEDRRRMTSNAKFSNNQTTRNNMIQCKNYTLGTYVCASVRTPLLYIKIVYSLNINFI